MDDPLRTIAASFGVFLTRDAKSVGYDDNAITRRVRDRDWVRVRHGAYTFPDVWAGLGETGRHVLRARAAYRTSKTPVAISHVSRALELTDRCWDLPLADVHLTRFDGKAGRREAGLCQHRGGSQPDDIEMVDGFLSMSATRTALDLSLLNDVDDERVLVVWDGLIHEGMTSVAEIEARYRAGFVGNPDTLHVPRLMSETDGRSGSVGETRMRRLFKVTGIPRPNLQHSVFVLGVLLGITDFWWPDYGVLGEFDGMIKYRRYLRPGETPGDAVEREKKREDAMREGTGLKFIRYIWSDLSQPERTRLRTEQMLRAPYFRVTIPLSS